MPDAPSATRPSAWAGDPALRAEATELVRDLIRIDTSNPPGNETAAATFLQGFLEREGVECELVARDPRRANLVARIPGRGEGPSLALLGHTDVVPVEVDGWTVPPFGGTVKDDHLWGRGALDMKAHTAANALAFARLARSGFEPAGDLLLIAESDEEDGTAAVGLEWLVGQRPDVRADYALNEGGGMRVELADGRVLYTLSCGEKAWRPLRLTVRGRAGHAAKPGAGDNALLKAGAVLVRLAEWSPRHRPSPKADALLDVLVRGDEPRARRAERVAELPAPLPWLMEAMRRSTVVPTRIDASPALNIVPDRVQIHCDCRALPGTSEEELVAELREALEGLDVEIEREAEPMGGTSSPLGTPLEDACRAFVERIDPGAELAPILSFGFTDSHWMRTAFGTVAYGFLPRRYTAAAVAGTAHAGDERIALDDVALAVEFLEHACRAVTAGARP